MGTGFFDRLDQFFSLHQLPMLNLRLYFLHIAFCQFLSHNINLFAFIIGNRFRSFLVTPETRPSQMENSQEIWIS